MRPPEHWHVRRTRHGRRQRPWLALLAVATLVSGVFLVRAAFFGGADSPVDVVAEPTPMSDVLAATSLPPSAYAVPPPKLTGQTLAVIEQPCGALLYGVNPHERRAPASLTKIATAIVAVEQAPLSELVDVQVNGALLRASSGSSVMGLTPGQRLSLRDLLYGLLLPSGNDAAIAIAEHISGSVPAFAALMNRRVEALGLTNTRFANPHGLDDLINYTSAYDIAMLGRELLRRPELAEIVVTQSYQPAWSGPPVWNGNRLIYDDPDTLGVKTGYTADAGQTIVAAAERDGRTLIVSVLGAWDRYADASALLNWAFASVPASCGPAFGGP
ncbi:MAG: D-alanyl-D-alanine carboxypeptidase [Chloroflexi bacterium]|nr:D-alanyl-D-alanine carboxypeptidase [Chloroflexota bacterium]